MNCFCLRWASFCLFLLLLLPSVGTAAQQFRIHAGFAPAADSLFPDAEAVRRFASALADHYAGQVEVRLFEDSALLPDWMDRFRAIDLSLIALEVLQNQPAGRLQPLLTTDTGEVFVLRQGLSPALRERIAQALQKVLSTPQWSVSGSGAVREVAHNPAVKNNSEDISRSSRKDEAAAESSILSTRDESRLQDAVVRARQGAIEEALKILSQLHARYPANTRVAYDYLTILGWAERDAEVVILADTLNLDRAPLHVVEATAKALRNHKWFETSADLYAHGMQRWPQHLPFALGRVMALAEAGQSDEARLLAGKLRQRHPERKDVLLACVYAAERAGDHLAALDLHQRLLELDPDDAGSLRGRIRALQLLGASHLAMHFAEQSPGLLSEEQWLRLRNDMAAHRLRWGSFAPEDDQFRYTETDQALGRIAGNLRRLYAADRAYPDLVRQARIDRLVALRNRSRMQEAVALYRTLRQDHEELPVYGLKAAADAYLYLQQPQKAQDIYREVLRRQPENFETRLALFYTEIELEEFDRATARIDQLCVDVRSEGGDDRRLLTAEVTAALARLFAGDLPQAQQRIETLHHHAPCNPDLKRELAGIYAARGWPRKSEATLENGLLSHPDHPGMQVARAQNHFDLRQYGVAQAAVQDLHARFPESKQVQGLARRSYLHGLRELWVEAGYSDSSEVEYGGDELRLASTLYSRPLYDHYRLFAGALWSRGDFAEGRGLYRRYRSGLEYRGRRLEGSAEINYTAAGADGVGVGVAGLLHQDDQRSWPFAVEIRSSATPTRALRNGIDADAIRFGFVHRAHERRRWSLGAGLMDFSDGNLRTHLQADVRQRLATRPHYHLDGVVDLYASLNKKSDVPYYSPQQDASASVTLDNTWLLWRRYQRAFRHRLALTLGAYQQQGYGTGPLLGARYEHMWQADGQFDLVYGIGWHRRIYDGDPENRVDGNLSVRWRF